MIVAISQRIDIIPGRDEIRDSLDQALVSWITHAGFFPIPIPNMEMSDQLCALLHKIKPDAILLSGGNDIGQFKSRDVTEATLLEYAASHEIPLLGICRGMQMMGSWLGAELHPIKNHIGCNHSVKGIINGVKNSYHAFSLSSCPKECEIISAGEDGEIEAVRHLTLPWEGWMWHPERESPFCESDLSRLKNLYHGN